MDPYTAAFNAIGGAVSTPPAGPSDAKSSGSIGGSMFDNSGWNVTFGTNSGVSTSRTQTTAGQFDQYMPYVVVGAVVLLGAMWLKKR